MQTNNTQGFYCERHNNHFWNICIGCMDDIMHQGFNIPIPSASELIASYEWDDTWEYIESL